MAALTPAQADGHLGSDQYAPANHDSAKYSVYVQSFHALK